MDFKTWNKILRSDAKDDALQIEVFAYQFGWNARYPGTDNELGKANYNLINGVNPTWCCQQKSCRRIDYPNLKKTSNN